LFLSRSDKTRESAKDRKNSWLIVGTLVVLKPPHSYSYLASPKPPQHSLSIYRVSTLSEKPRPPPVGVSLFSRLADAEFCFAPTDPITIVRRDPDDGLRRLDVVRCVLIPYCVKEVKIGYSTFISAC
jgi:hypothetical protein